MEDFTQDDLAAAFAENKQRLFALAEKRLNPILLKRMSAEDVLSETYVHAAKRLDYLAAHDDVPIYYKLRTILIQTIADIERHHLKAQGRDAYKELRVESGGLSVEGEEAQPEGGGKAQKDDQRVAEHVQSVEQILVFFDHKRNVLRT